MRPAGSVGAWQVRGEGWRDGVCARAAVRGGCAEGVTRVRLPLNLQDALREAGRHGVRLRVRSGAQVLGKDLAR